MAFELDVRGSAVGGEQAGVDRWALANHGTTRTMAHCLGKVSDIDSHQTEVVAKRGRTHRRPRHRCGSGWR
jgi:hypothetical protein